jgi:type I restriction enzyme S subunit
MDNVMMEEKVLKLDKSNWVPTKLGDLATEISKRVDNPSDSEYDRFVSLRCFVSGDIKIKSWETTETLVSSAKAFEVGDILFARRNAYLRRASMVDFEGCCSGDAFVLRENHDKMVPGFLAFLLNSDALWDYANSNAAGTMSKRVKWRDLAEYEFLLPPKDQQAKLAELLWAMDEVVERENEVLSKLNISKRAYEKEKLIKYKNGIERDLPKEYKIYRLSEITEITGGSTPSRIVEEYWGGNIPWLTPTDVTNHNKILLNQTREYITDSGLKNISNRLYPVGSILFCSRATIGYAIINDVPMATNQGFSNFICNEKVNNYFLYFLLKHLTNELTRLAGGSTFLEISKSSIRRFKVVIPPDNIMMKITDKLIEYEKTRLEIESKISSSKALQKSLINQVF